MDIRTIWITGLSGSGKTTLANAVVKQLRPKKNPILIDGDQIRLLFGGDLGFDEVSRQTQIGRIQRLAKLLTDQAQTVVVAALYSHPDLLAWNRKNLPGYFEVYLDLPLSFVAERDSKGLYAAAEAKRTMNVVGVDIAWHPPENSNFVFDEASIGDPDEMAHTLIMAMEG